MGPSGPTGFTSVGRSHRGRRGPLSQAGPSRDDVLRCPEQPGLGIGGWTSDLPVSLTDRPGTHDDGRWRLGGSVSTSPKVLKESRFGVGRGVTDKSSIHSSPLLLGVATRFVTETSVPGPKFRNETHWNPCTTGQSRSKRRFIDICRFSSHMWYGWSVPVPLQSDQFTSHYTDPNLGRLRPHED